MEPQTTGKITTADFACLLKLKPASIRRRFALTSSYFGIRPEKLPNGKLLWPANALEQLLGGKQ